MNRLKFVYCKGGAVSWISFAALLLAAILVGICLYTALFGSIVDMPFMSVIDTITDGSVDELEDVLRDGKDVEREARAALKDMKKDSGTLSKSEKKLLDLAEEVVDDLGKLIDTPSLMVMRRLVGNICEEQELIERLELAGDPQSAQDLQREAEDVLQVLKVVVIVIIVCFVPCILLTFLAAMLRSTVLTVFGMLGAVPLCALFGGVIFVLAVLVLDITAMILHGVLKKKYQKFLYPGYAG